MPEEGRCLGRVQGPKAGWRQSVRHLVRAQTWGWDPTVWDGAVVESQR